ncbi:MAG: hypothetical protein ACRCV9_13840 [Burkholderiaceae bacterium]
MSLLLALTQSGGASQPYGLAAEVDGAFALAQGGIGQIFGTASEADAAIALVARESAPHGLAVTVDLPLTTTARELAAVGLAAAVEVALTTPLVERIGLGLAVEVDTALQLAQGAANRPYGVATEIDQAVALVVVGATVPDAGGSSKSGLRWLNPLIQQRVIREFLDEKERKRTVKALPDVSAKEREIVKRVARELAADALAGVAQFESRLSVAIKSGGAKPSAAHGEWLIYFMRVEAYRIAHEIEEEESLALMMML